MSDETPTVEKRLLQYTFILTPYATLLSMLYLIGYWSTFKINIISFIDLSDILKLSLLPLLIVMIVSITLSSIMVYLSPLGSIEIDDYPRRVVVILIVLLAIAPFVAFYIYKKDKWAIVGIILATLLFLIFRKVKILERLIADTRIRTLIIMLIVLPPFYSFWLGRTQARVVINNPSSTRFVDVKVFRDYGSDSFTKKQMLDKQDKLKFIGTANDYVFFTSVDNSKLYIVKFSDLHYLEFNN
jgi:hypothetical protein